MITFLAPLARGLRLSPHRPAPLPAASIHYGMPRSRCLFAGLSVSALFHAGLFFGLNNDKPPLPVPTGATVIEPFDPWKVLCTIEPPPPPPPDPTKPTTDNTDPKASHDDEYSRLPDLPPSGSLNDLFMEIPALDRGLKPDLGKNLGGIPGSPGSGNHGPGKLDDVWNEKDLDRRPEVTYSVAPRYPGDLRSAGLKGDVVVRFVVTPKGDVRDVVVVSADHARFGDAAVEALVRWRFEPGMKNKRKVSTRMELPLRFLVTN